MLQMEDALETEFSGHHKMVSIDQDNAQEPAQFRENSCTSEHGMAQDSLIAPEGVTGTSGPIDNCNQDDNKEEEVPTIPSDHGDHADDSDSDYEDNGDHGESSDNDGDDDGDDDDDDHGHVIEKRKEGKVAPQEDVASGQKTPSRSRERTPVRQYSFEVEDVRFVQDENGKKRSMFKCPVVGCDKVYPKPWRLQDHMCSHTGTRPIVCTHPGCDKSFIRQSHLKRHLLIHSGERPFLCQHENCGLSFVTSTHLKRHLKVHEKQKPYECTEPGCSAAFSKHLQLKKHQYMHTGEFAHRCEVEGCGKSFKMLIHLKEHTALHHSETPRYFCNREGCTEGFPTWTKLNEHKRRHRGAKRIRIESTSDHQQESERESEPSRKKRRKDRTVARIAGPAMSTGAAPQPGPETESDLPPAPDQATATVSAQDAQEGGLEPTPAPTEEN